MDSIKSTKTHEKGVVPYKERKGVIKKLIWKQMQKERKYKFKCLKGQKKITDYFKALSWSNCLCDSIWISILCLESGGVYKKQLKHWEELISHEDIKK